MWLHALDGSLDGSRAPTSANDTGMVNQVSKACWGGALRETPEATQGSDTTLYGNGGYMSLHICP